MKLSKSVTNEEFLDAYETYADAIFRYCYFRLYDREKAKDCLQETFTKTWQYLVKGGEIKNLRAFLYQVARRLIIDDARKKHTASLSLDELLEQGFNPGHDPREHVRITLDANAILAILSQLHHSYREVIQLRYVDGLAPREIAVITGESVNVISVRIHRGLKKLRELYEKNT